MAETFYSVITTIGKAKIANSQVSDNKVNFAKIAVGDGNGTYYNPSESQTELRNEVWRGNVGNVDIDEKNDNWIVVDTVIPSDVGGFHVREVGLFDDLGDMIAVGKYPESYKPIIENGSAKDMYIRIIIEVSNVASVQLKIDPTIAIPSRDWVNKQIEEAKAVLIPKSAIGKPNGVAGLNESGKLPSGLFDSDPAVLEQQLEVLEQQLGNLSSLETEEKENLVAAINNIKGLIDAHKADYQQEVLEANADNYSFGNLQVNDVEGSCVDYFKPCNPLNAAIRNLVGGDIL